MKSRRCACPLEHDYDADDDDHGEEVYDDDVVAMMNELAQQND